MVQKRIKNEEYRTIEDFQKGPGSANAVLVLPNNWVK